MTTLAIDIGGTKLAAARVDTGLRVRARREMPTPASRTPDALEAALAALVTPLREGAERVAVASTGIIRNGVLSAINPANLGGLASFPLVETLRRITGLPTLALNDAQAAAWAEYHALPADVQDMVFLTISTGVGGGIISSGNLLTGVGGLAGHVGHTLADPHGPRCGCGRKGCVEAIASGRGIAAAAQGNLQGLDARAIFIRAAQGDAQANVLVQRSAQVLVRLIVDLKALTDCECVVIGGSVGLAAGYLAHVERFLSLEPPVYHVPLITAHFQHDAGLLGAARFAQGARS